jgi:hypothetical protein
MGADALAAISLRAQLQSGTFWATPAGIHGGLCGHFHCKPKTGQVNALLIVGSLFAEALELGFSLAVASAAPLPRESTAAE